MKVLILAAAIVATGASSQVAQRGYVTRNGTYVAPTYRTAPNSTVRDNYSTAPNVNPYNGRIGTVNPNTYQAPAPYRAPRRY